MTETTTTCPVEKVGLSLIEMRKDGVGFDPQPLGTRTRIWKQDPTLPDLGIRTVYLPSTVLVGPRDGVIQIEGIAPVSPDNQGDFLPSTTTAEAFDAVHTFSVVRMALTLYERQVGTLPWQWNAGGGSAAISVFPNAGIQRNAFYSREEQSLKFFEFFSDTLSRTVFTCRSLDIVAHETGHAVLDSLQPRWIETRSPQTGGLHEAFGDLTSIFLMLSIFDLVEYVVAETKADLHQSNALAALAEEFGAAIARGHGRPPGLRNAFNKLKLSDVTNEVHEISKVFTGALYRILADLYAARRRPQKKDDAELLHEIGAYLSGLLIQAIKKAPAADATFADVARALIDVARSAGDNDLAALVKAEFRSREVLNADGGLGFTFPKTPIVSFGRCGTMHRYVARAQVTT